MFSGCASCFFSGIMLRLSPNYGRRPWAAKAFEQPVASSRNVKRSSLVPLAAYSFSESCASARQAPPSTPSPQPLTLKHFQFHKVAIYFSGHSSIRQGSRTATEWMSRPKGLPDYSLRGNAARRPNSAAFIKYPTQNFNYFPQTFVKNTIYAALRYFARNCTP